MVDKNCEWDMRKICETFIYFRVRRVFKANSRDTPPQDICVVSHTFCVSDYFAGQRQWSGSYTRKECIHRDTTTFRLRVFGPRCWDSVPPPPPSFSRFPLPFRLRPPFPLPYLPPTPHSDFRPKSPRLNTLFVALSFLMAR